MEVMHDEARRRFYVVTEHGEAELLYKMEGRIMNMYRTFVPEADRGRGIAERLAVSAFGFAKDKRIKVRPGCSYIVEFLEKHSEFREYAVG